ncbi:ABC transporter permease [Tunicatimonas pelagia]|uniref:ABC transporter permease n=1 Tax=Tunicatimonas pelagia TaxID=931531 RepID=UPI002664EE5C|nr:ABC transporter permease [Tunicatimonas pelagia]WKN42834.1 ABC transporter permease [Tunicatimonas pelagia]
MKASRLLVPRLIYESLLSAWDALRSNPLRTILSLLGVTIGIFAIIAVFTLIDSLERNIRDSLDFLGDQVIRVEKWPWLFEDSYPWWKYINRPQPTLNEFEFLQANVSQASAMCIFADRENLTLEHKNSNIGGVYLVGASYQYNQVFEVDINQGRYFSVRETEFAQNVVIIGSEVAKSLFPMSSPLGKVVEIKGLKFVVVGVLTEQGENIIDAPSADYTSYIPYQSFLKLYASRSRWGVGSTLGLKGYERDEGLKELEFEVIGLMRGRRGLRPRQEDNFAINRPEAFAEVVNNIFNVISLAGGIIGSFSILVGGFGIANIMFVSVKERTNIIGIQKSLGAKNYFILLQFLFEATFLSLIGGVVGMFLVYLTTFVSIGSLELQLTIPNILIGLTVSSTIGIISGLIPAITASRLNPVVAIRS